jgi:hypothetical protein
MKQRLRRYRGMAWMCGVAMIVTIPLASLAWSSGWRSVLFVAQAAAILSAVGIAICLSQLARLRNAARQIDFAAGAAGYSLSDLSRFRS